MKEIRYREELWQLLQGKQGDIAEIGVAEGLFSHDMLHWPVYFSRLYMVDHWKYVPGTNGDSSHPQEWHDRNYREAIARVKRFKERVVVLRGDSADMARLVPDQSLILAYLDADHRYEAVLRDLKAWHPKVKPGGIVAVHDYEMEKYGVKKAVKEFCGNRITIHLLPADQKKDAGAYFYVD